MVYNAAYAQVIADKHPAALGRPAREVFPEAWDQIGPMMEGVLRGEDATYVEDLLVPLQRNGRLEECWFTFSYSAVRSETGVVEGVLDIATETTRRVLDRRRLELLAVLGAELADAEDEGEVLARATAVLASATRDLPRADVRLGEDPVRPGVWVEDGIASLGLGARGGTLLVRLSEHLVPDDAYLEYLRLVASSIGQALERAAEHGVAEALQRSLLAEPPKPPGLEIAVRYRPAAERARIGGDWYDAFTLPGDVLTAVVGDVTGHDATAAAAMAIVRNLLRGVAWTLVDARPARVLEGLDRAMHGLEVEVFATAIMAQVAGAEVRWANAGHLPPVLVEADGAARVLDTTPDLLLGVGGATRVDHRVALGPGAALVLYTDGLVERRGVPLTESLTWLAGALDGCTGMGAQELADHVLGSLDAEIEDDVALLVLRRDGA